ncbi:MAG: hypothetical protein ABIN18_08615 [Pseudomonadota bacterium]
METITIEIDIEVYVKLKEIADPFVDTTPNLVIRRLLGLPKKKIEKMHGEMGSSRYHSAVTVNRQGVAVGNKIVGLSSSSAAVEKLRSSSPHSHPAFLTFLMDKFQNTHGNYKTSDIVPFLETANLRTLSGSYRNPWMPAPYKTLNSCTRTIEHFRQTRKFGCWGGKDTKANCDARDTCIYHPDNQDPIRNKCDLRKGVIWKRANPESPYEYGMHYVEVVKQELLSGAPMPLEPLLSVLYLDSRWEEDLVSGFTKKFHFNEREMELFSLRSKHDS